ncbi:hypothetical protein Tco_1568093 [Tanacetum coccineum]
MIHELDVNKNSVRKEVCGNEDGDEVVKVVDGGNSDDGMFGEIRMMVVKRGIYMLLPIVGNGISGKSDENSEKETDLNGKGEEVVAFDEELINEGKVRWKNTVCVYFVGCSVHVYEVKYNLRRMWMKHGLSNIVIDEEELCFVKFKNKEGMNYVIDESP